MRRILGGPGAIYHCITRTVNGERCIDDAAKEVLRRQLHQTVEFCGVELITYVLMENHFHLLVRVPPKPEGGLPDAELVRRYRILYPKPTKFVTTQVCVLEDILAAGGPAAEQLRAKLMRQMYDLGLFMKLLKQRFSTWFNRSHRRFGTLWATRYSNTAIEGCPMALRTVAAYIDLNPVRAGIVKDPADYRFCGYGEAVATGGLGTRLHLRKTSPNPPEAESDRALLASYRQALFAKGSVAKAHGGAHAANLSADAHDREQARHGVMPLPERLRRRVAWFSRGVALGTEAFVREKLATYSAATGRRARGSPRDLSLAERDAAWPALFTLRGGRV